MIDAYKPIRREIVTKHWKSYTAAYSRWTNMKDRCRNKRNIRFHRYGGRGIGICKKWESFDNFYYDMGDPPCGMTLDRIDNNKGYSKENCRWATYKEQQRNMHNSIFLEFNGIKKHMYEWADQLKIKRGTLYTRLRRGWSIEKSFSQPVL